jgi:hypothetical protein
MITGFDFGDFDFVKGALTSASVAAYAFLGLDMRETQSASILWDRPRGNAGKETFDPGVYLFSETRHCSDRSSSRILLFLDKGNL